MRTGEERRGPHRTREVQLYPACPPFTSLSRPTFQIDEPHFVNRSLYCTETESEESSLIMVIQSVSRQDREGFTSQEGRENPVPVIDSWSLSGHSV